MSYLCFKNQINSSSQIDEIYLIEIKIDEQYLRHSSSYTQSIKDTYISRDYLLKISSPISNINELDTNKYYLCFDKVEKHFGLKKKDDIFVRLIEFDRKTFLENKDYPELKIRLFNLFFNDKFLSLV
jgi:hypothetical protein